jgi:3-oxoacyl-[acyl-carrier protein] reductase
VDGEAGRLTALPPAGRAALVTGVSRQAGIGRAIASRLEQLGASVFRHGWTAHDEAQPWGAEPRVEHFEADLADRDAPAAVVAAAS